jgi:iron-sulfur cluster insertion protein
MITVTESARSKMADMIAEENNAALKVRAFVQGGGCSGFSYGFTFDETVNEDDFEIDKILVDSMSMQYLSGAVIDYKDDLHGSQFIIQNPNAQTTCGCGSSFSV